MRSGPVTAVSKSALAARHWRRAARRIECNAATKRQPTGASSPDVLSRLPPEAMQLYHQAQNNIVALNDSRLKALNALSAARARIDELESEVEELRQEVKQTSYRLADALDVEGAATTQAETEVEGDAGSDGIGSQSAQQAGMATITLAYFTGWEPAYLHYCTDEQEWTKAPGLQMERGEGEFEGAYVLRMTGSMAQFVPNDGGNQWDNCPRNGGNYTIESGPGTYVLRDGQIMRA